MSHFLYFTDDIIVRGDVMYKKKRKSYVKTADDLRASETFFAGSKESRRITADSLVPKVGFKRLSEGVSLPTKAHATDSGFDICASEDVIIEPGDTKVVPTGIAVKLPNGYEAQIRPRSGVTSKTKLRVQLGTIDNGYNGEIGVIVDNDLLRTPAEILYGIDGVPIHNKGIKYPDVTGSYLIRKGDRIAQLVVQSLPSVEVYEIEDDIGETDRGAGGFGSTGYKEDRESLYREFLKKEVN